MPRIDLIGNVVRIDDRDAAGEMLAGQRGFACAVWPSDNP
jgi:hypothetical protein